MSNITLREYHLYIDDLLEKSAISEALVHCTHILSHFPKSIKTYQQLGQALLEQKRYADAAEVFSKVISVFPDDFVAHAGLSIVHEENRDLDKAIWHMEQAFETQPSNSAIQEEFRRLISRRDGALPSKIRLTRGALIRMYAKGELYQQAIAESLSALQADPERIDLKLLLARMYTLTNAETSAAEICTGILQDHPYCFEANRIMFELASSASDPEGYNPVHLQRLSELDPYFGFISTASENVENVPAEKVTLEKTEYFSRHEEYSRSPEWADKIGIPWHDDSEDTLKSQAQPVSFEGSIDDDLLSELLTPTPFIEDEAASTEIEPTPESVLHEGPAPELPEWIAKAGWVRANEDEHPVASAESYEELPVTEIPDEAKPPAEPAESLPDWLQSIQTEGSDAPQLFASSEGEGIPEATIPPLPPEMLAELLSEGPEPFADIPVTFAGTKDAALKPSETPIDKESLELPGATGDEPVPDLPDWLKDLEVIETQVPDGEQDLSLQDETPETEAEPVPAVFEISDFLAEIETSDLIGELNEITEEESVSEESSQPIPEELVDFEIEFDLIDAVRSEPPLSQDEPDFIPPEIVETEPISLEPATPELLEQEETEPVKTTTPTSIPAWVKNILADKAESTPIISATPSIGVESEAVILSSPADSEEIIEELITDLPDEPVGAGAISEEVTAELETWLNEVDSEEIDVSTAEPETLAGTVSDEKIPEISLESLSESTETEESQGLEAEVNFELPAEVGAFDDRLSSMLGAEEVSLAEPVSVETNMSGVAKEDIERVVDLLQSGDFSSFTHEISKLPSQDEVSDQLISELEAALQHYPDNFELWQNMGDLLSRKANFEEALDAYREAEKNIFI